MDLAEFDYPLPPERIAQTAAEPRDAARLLVFERASGRVEHAVFRDLPQFLPGPARFFRNNAAVLKARLRGFRPTGGAVECLLLRPAEVPGEWWCLLRPGRKLPAGAEFGLDGAFRATVRHWAAEGQARVAFALKGPETELTALAERVGEVPLPPYIARHPGDPRGAGDAARYQTVYADPARRVAVAAPTAGLHFTPALLERLRAGGAEFHDLTLHVGPGTFQPLGEGAVEAQRLHTELYELPAATLAALRAPGPGPRVAVGTTTVRAAEDGLARAPDPAAGPWVAEAGLFIYPPRTFRGLDALITNFHLPRSSLLCLVAAFLEPGGTGGVARLRALYGLAIEHGYRFYSYGDAMLVL